MEVEVGRVIPVGKHRAERRLTAPLVLATAAVVGVAVIAFLLVRLVGGTLGSTAATPSPVATGAATASAFTPATSSTTTTTTTATSATGPATPTTSAADAAARAALTACVDRQNAAKGLVDAMATGAGHWGDHLQGQTDISSGKRSYIDVKTTTWGPTKAAGPGDVAEFQAAQTAYAAAPGCPTSAGQLPAPAEVAPKLQACAAREQSLDAVVATGTVVLGDWATHLTEMAQHSDGHLDGSQAEATWIQRWEDAPAHLDPYRAAAAALAAAPACSA